MADVRAVNRALAALLLLGLVLAGVARVLTRRAPATRIPAPHAMPRCVAYELARYTDSTGYFVKRRNGERCRLTLPEDATLLPPEVP